MNKRLQITRRLALAGLILVIGMGGICPGSGGNQGGQTPAPTPVMITLPGGASCNEGDLQVTAQAWIETEQGSASTMAVVRVCVKCSGTGIANVTGIKGQLTEEMAMLPPGLAGEVAFRATNPNGCTVKRFRRVPDALAGKQFKVTVVDSAGGSVWDEAVTVDDRR